MTGSERIAAERERQVKVEGYDAKHDRGGTDRLATAGAIYAMPAEIRDYEPFDIDLPWEWPWDKSAWKPTPGDRIRELTKAGALIAAAIDALLDQGDS